MRQREQTSASGERPEEGDIVQRLRAEHAWLQELVKSALGARGAKRRSELAQSIRFHWAAHADAEERCVYWPLAGHMQTADWVNTSRLEHARIDRHVDQLIHEDPQSTAWRDHARDLASALDAHTHTEEMGVLSRIPVVLGKEERFELGEAYARLRTQGPIHPRALGD